MPIMTGLVDSWTLLRHGSALLPTTSLDPLYILSLNGAACLSFSKPHRTPFSTASTLLSNKPYSTHCSTSTLYSTPRTSWLHHKQLEPNKQPNNANQIPPKMPSAPPIKPNPMRNLSEFAVADTPGTSGPDFTGADYLTARANPRLNSQSQSQAQGRCHSPGYDEGSVSTALGQGVVPSSRRQRRGTMTVADFESQGGEQQNENENVEAQGKMATFGEGEVAHAMEGARRGRGDGFGRHGASGEGRGVSQGLSPHGRGRGEVTLEVGEADLER